MGHWVLISILIPLLQCGAQWDPAATISVTLDIWYVPPALLPWDSYNLVFYLETEEAKMKLHFIDKLQNID